MACPLKFPSSDGGDMHATGQSRLDVCMGQHTHTGPTQGLLHVRGPLASATP